MMEWVDYTQASVPVRGEVSRAAVSFRVTREGKLMPTLPENGADAPVAYPRHIVTDDRPTGEQTLSERFFAQNPAHLIGRRTTTGVWPDDSADADARGFFEAGQQALYQTKDANAAIAAYESAVERDSSYIKAWVALAIAYITDNTPDSLNRAEDVLTFLAGIEPSDWLTREASGIIFQNRAYLAVHRFRQGGERDKALLEKASADYAVCDTLTEVGRERLEYLCPWAYVQYKLGETETAKAIWTRALERARVLNAAPILAEYMAKYTPLQLLKK